MVVVERGKSKCNADANDAGGSTLSAQFNHQRIGGVAVCFMVGAGLTEKWGSGESF